MRLIAMLWVLTGCAGPTMSGATGDGDDATDGGVDGGSDVTQPCTTPAQLATTGRVLDLMPAQRLAEIAAAMPCVVDGPVKSVVESPRTLWYDKQSLVPGYQDSFGDNVVTPIGMRPNTIDPELIDLAVPGGHAQIFSELGSFHFPFGHPIGPVEQVRVVDFWQLPEGNGAPLPVVYWRRDPNEYTHRVEWMFPKGTVFGELLLIADGGALVPFEIRTRTRTLEGWAVDVLRPFLRAVDLADAIEARGLHSAGLDALVAQLRADTLDAYQVSATHFAGAFEPRDSGIELLPALDGDDAAAVRELMRTTAFRSARGIAWKTSGDRVAWAAGARGAGSIVPAGFNAAAIEVSEPSCDTCHRDAGRPFETWYDNILAYGELWGNDEIFTWHPFTTARFVDGAGHVVGFNHDNREIRPDMVAAGLVAPYVPANHPSSVYQRIVRSWTDFVY
ncbi:MAG TPA: hypothetical protein VFQ53_07380 [Kofleriaceae bacterium]|nr:hypothetical protein [Kofleriaceae bacterium]